jgi:two-component system, LytTR family, sensor kinase
VGSISIVSIVTTPKPEVFTSRQRRLNWRLAIAAAALLTILFGLQQWMAQPPSRQDLDLGTALLLQAVTWGMWLLLLPLIIRVAAAHPLEGRPTSGWLLRSAIEGAAFVAAHSVLSGTMRWALGISISSNLGVVFANTFSFGFASNCLRYCVIFVCYQAVVYHDVVRERDLRAARLEMDLARAKLSNVEACLRPHFLFNTLNAIAALVRDDPRLAERMIGELSDLLRASLSGETSKEVCLDEELAFTRKYLDLEGVRFQDRLRFSIEASAEARRALVPYLLLQPLVENAVRHGLAPLESGGSILVDAARENGMLRVTIRDDGVGLDGAGTSRRQGIGLESVRARLAHLYGAGHRFDLSPATPRGTVVNLELPYRTIAS